MRNFETAFYDFPLSDNNSFEQWTDEGSQDIQQRANAKWKRMLREFEAPAMDDGVAKRWTRSWRSARPGCRTPGIEGVTRARYLAPVLLQQ